MLLYVNGCSHTAYTDDIDDQLWAHILMSSMCDGYIGYHKIKKLELFKIKNIKQHYLINEAKHGGGNDYIFHSSLETLQKLIDNNTKPDLVIIQWSGTNRRIHQSVDETIYFVNPYDNPTLHLKYEPMGSLHSLHYMFCLQEFLKKNQINYRFFNYMAFDNSVTKNQIYSELDFSNIIDFGFGENTLTTGILEYITKKKYNRDEQGHANYSGNYYIAKYIADSIEIKLNPNKNLL